MIPYETVRSHLEHRHWTSTDGFSWEELVVIHDQAHESAGHYDTRPPIQPALYPTLDDVPTGDVQ